MALPLKSDQGTKKTADISESLDRPRKEIFKETTLIGSVVIIVWKDFIYWSKDLIDA